jgi:hypothetical protein
LEKSGMATTFAEFFGGTPADPDYAAIVAELQALRLQVDKINGIAGDEVQKFTFTDASGNRLPGAVCHITSDVTGQTIVLQDLVADSLGQVHVKLLPDTYYLWVHHKDYEATNPTEFTVEDVTP